VDVVDLQNVFLSYSVICHPKFGYCFSYGVRACTGF